MKPSRRHRAALLALVLGGSLGAAVTPAGANIPPPRSVEEVYQGAEGIVTSNAGIHQNVAGEAQVFFRPERGERSFMIEIVDQAGQNVAAGVYVDRNGNGRIDEKDNGFDMCGATEAPTYLDGASQVIVEIYAGECVGSTTPSVPTSGVVRATFR
ncbi:MAG TPA: hypothetical protein VNC78_01795 [Actinomycetota bacterium]|nr:hypothetical protein [Actinomycetota bacterium]